MEDEPKIPEIGFELEQEKIESKVHVDYVPDFEVNIVDRHRLSLEEVLQKHISKRQ